MDQPIQNARLSFTCNQNWDAMQADTDGRFCSGCQKKVYDMTDKKVAYFIQVMEENNHNVCARFTARQMAPQKHPYWKKWAIAAMVFIGFGTAAQQAAAQDGCKQGKIAPPKQVIPDEPRPVLLGDVVPDPVNVPLFRLHEYLENNCKVPASTNGKLAISFSLTKDGSLENIALTQQLSPAVRQEVLRHLKTAPKWKKPLNTPTGRHSLFLSFKNGKIEPYQMI